MTNRFIINSDDTVTDTTTNLMWQRNCLPDTYTWDEARELTSNLGGYNDWRLPTVKELLSLVDCSEYNPDIDTIYFPNTPPSWFWSSSPYTDYDDYAWVVAFPYGGGSDSYKNVNYQVLLVRETTQYTQTVE